MREGGGEAVECGHPCKALVLRQLVLNEGHECIRRAPAGVAAHGRRMRVSPGAPCTSRLCCQRRTGTRRRSGSCTDQRKDRKGPLAASSSNSQRNDTVRCILLNTFKAYDTMTLKVLRTAGGAHSVGALVGLPRENHLSVGKPCAPHAQPLFACS